MTYPKHEKEALCIVEALKHWKHLLTLRKFTLVTTQRALDLKYGEQTRSKIKTLKITNWKLELASFQFDTRIKNVSEDYSIKENIKTKPKLGVVTRKISDLHQTHQWLCHPGSPKLWHYVKQQNLNYTKAEVENI